MILKHGSRSESVRELQSLLNKHGFWSHPTMTEFFGSVTYASVINFQKANGLKADGIVGPKTWEVLTRIVSNKIEPVYSEDFAEDFSDPEEAMFVGSMKESNQTCPNIQELISLINSTNLIRGVKRVVFHCTATNQSATVSAISNYWKNQLGWKNPGYHIIIKPNGEWTQLQDFNRLANGVAGLNSESIHISYIGGIDSRNKPIDNRTDEQKEVLSYIYETFSNKFPNLVFNGHYEFSRKACPSFDVPAWIGEIKSDI